MHAPLRHLLAASGGSEPFDRHPSPDGKEHGVFATRSPSRPNPLALDIVELLEVKENRLKVRGMDAMDGSILLDIKPYSAGIDSFPHAKIAWQKDGEA